VCKHVCHVCVEVSFAEIQGFNIHMCIIGPWVCGCVGVWVCRCVFVCVCALAFECQLPYKI